MTVPTTPSTASWRTWRLLHLSLGLVVLTLAVLTGWMLLAPVREDRASEIPSAVVASDRLQETKAADPNGQLPSASQGIVRSGLFKALSPLRPRPTGDKTVEHVTSLLSLNSIMPVDGQRVAYVTIKNKGMRRCAVGDCVEETFTVLSIQEDCVEIEVAGKRVKLGYK